METLNCNYALLLQAGPDDTGVVLFASFATVPVSSPPDPDDRCRIGEKGAERSRRRPIETGLCGIESPAYDSDLGRPRAGAVGKVMQNFSAKHKSFVYRFSPSYVLHLVLCVLHSRVYPLVKHHQEVDYLTDNGPPYK